MKNLLIFSLLIMAFIFSGCSKTTVVLLPDDDGNVGKVIVATEGGETVLDKENQFTQTTGSKPDDPKLMTKDQIDTQFKGAIDALPAKPVSFMLYFVYGTSRLTESSKKIIPSLLDAIKEREPSEVSVIGHTDTVGRNEDNIVLSTKRAESVRDLLKSAGVNISKMHVSSHGENDPIVKTGDNVPEPKNRRVEVMVR